MTRQFESAEGNDILHPDRLATPSGVAEVLQRYDLAPRKGLGQNFLVDRNVLRQIVAAARLSPDDTIIEIGPGLGVLTWALAETARTVIAVEVDAGLVRWLERLLRRRDNVRLIHADALQVDLQPLLAAHPPGPEGAYKVIANLPYYITTPLLMRLLEEALPLDSIVVMVQREVAQRIVASPGGKDYGVLSVNVQYRSQAEILFHVPPTVFIPRPEVHSAVVRLRPHPKPETLPVPPDHMAAVVRAAFSRRRKTIRNALRSAFPPDGVEAALARAHIAGERRAETLSVEEFVQLAAALPPSGHDPSPA